MKKNELDELCKNINPKAKLPRHFDLWSEKLQIMWLRQHQKKNKD